METFLNFLAGAILVAVAIGLWRANLSWERGDAPQTLTGRVGGQTVRFNPASLLTAARQEEEQP